VGKILEIVDIRTNRTFQNAAFNLRQASAVVLMDAYWIISSLKDVD